MLRDRYLFRGKRVDNGEWVHGDLVINKPTQTYRIFTDYANVRHGDYTESGLHEDSGCLYIVDPKTVGQFTGTKDGDGERLFEGDTIRNEDRDEVGVIVYDPNICFFCITDDYPDTIYNCDMINVPGDGWMSHEIKKIGNVHDNLELLNNQKQ